MRRSTGTAMAAGVGLGTGVARGVLGANDRINVGFIGVGGMGTGTLGGFLKHDDVAVLAVADVYEKHRERAKNRIGRPDVTMHNDFRELLDRKEIDAVVVSTPDHWHALASIHAMLAGKDVYCEKPLTHRIAEGQAMTAAAARHKRVTQMGTQIHAKDNYRRVVEIVRSGILGKISMVRVWLSGKNPPQGLGKPADEAPPPGLDWDLWQGPAKRRPYNVNRCIFNFRFFWDYSNGKFGDFICHYCDLVHWAMGIDAPVSASATGDRLIADDNAETPDVFTAIYRYPKPGPTSLGGPTGGLPPAETPDDGFVLSWQHSMASATGLSAWGHYGVCFQGTNGSLMADYNRHEVFPDKKGFSKKDLKTIPESVPRSKGHHREFLDNIRSRQLCSCHFEYGHRLTSLMHLGNIALWTGKTLAWDPKVERIVNDADANQHLTKEYHNNWGIPSV
jgi:predicted dehydrogenase